MKKKHLFSNINGHDFSHIPEAKAAKLFVEDRLYDKDLNHKPVKDILSNKEKKYLWDNPEVADEFIKDCNNLITATENVIRAEKIEFCLGLMKSPIWDNVLAIIRRNRANKEEKQDENYCSTEEVETAFFEYVQGRLTYLKSNKMKTTQDYINEVKANLDLLEDSEFVLKFFTQAEAEGVLVLTKEQKDIIFRICLDTCNNNREEARKLARYRSVIRLIE